MKKQILIFLIAVFGVWACNSNKSENASNLSINTEVLTLQAQTFQQKIQQTPEAQVLDVRTPEECASGMIAKATQIEYGTDDFEQKLNKLDKKKPVFVYCRSGGRSAKAAEKLKTLGFEKIFDLQGGIKSWTDSGLPLSMNH